MESVMTEAFERISAYFEELRESVRRCQSDPSPLNLKAAYDALARLRERFVQERKNGNLTAEELRVLEKALDKDEFIKGMMNIRQVGAHVVQRGKDDEVQIWTTENVPFRISAEVSAMPMFASHVAIVRDTTGCSQEINHLKMFAEALKRIGKASPPRAGED
jgi:hypothetical protein